MNKQENNKLIVEFMGYSFENEEYYRPLYNSGDWYKEDELLFHESWDWLMPVVQECYKSDNEELFDELVDSVSTLSIVNTYNSVVEFIKANKKESK
jgi:hypothetical protein